VQAGAQLQFPLLQSNAPAAIAVAAGAAFNATLAQIAARTNIAFDAAGNAVAAFAKLNLSAPLLVSGPGLLQFPARAEDSTCTGQQCSASVNGGAKLSGNAGPITLNIQPSATAEARATVPAGAVFAIASNVLGAANALLEIAGEMWATGQTIQTQARINGGGKLVLGSATGGVFQAGDVSLATGGTLNLKNGGQTYLRKFDCPAGASLTADISGSMSTSTPRVLINYGANTNVTNIKCSVVLTDGTGATAIATSASASASTSRRLLGTSCQTTWGQTSAVYTCSTTSAAPAAATVSVAVIIASIIAAFALMF